MPGAASCACNLGDRWLPPREANPQPVPGLNVADAGDMEAFVLANGTTLYFDSDRAGGLGATDIYVASAAAQGGFEALQAVPNVSSSKADKLPVVTPDELTMLLASDRGGSMDIYISRRVSKALPFDVPTPVTELNTSGDDYPSWISPDGCRVLMFSDRGGSGPVQIYQASRPR
jgi:Tol biopolymer transport system component